MHPFQQNNFTAQLLRKLSSCYINPKKSLMQKVYSGFVLLGIGVIALSNSGGAASGPAGARTGAPGEGTCSNCHGGGSFGASVLLEVFQNGTTTPATSYVGGNTYDVKVTVNKTTGNPKFAFQSTVLNTSNAMAGSFNTPGSNTQVTPLGARSYIEHNAASIPNIFTAKWVAPPALTGTVTFYVNGNCVNGTGGTSGDQAAGSQLSLPEFSTPLYANVTQFSVAQTQQSNSISWTTAQEKNNAYFSIQKSIDGKNFQDIARINSKGENGNSSVELNYNFVDDNQCIGANYYRLLSTDIDGQFSYVSDIKKIVVKNHHGVAQVYPNPAQDILTVSITAHSNNTIQLVNMNGQVVKRTELNASASNHNVEMNIREIPQGIYFLQIIENGVVIKVEKILKQ
jgi:hypothetical protein